MDKQVNNKRKGVTEIADRGYLCAHNPNLDHHKAISGDPYVYRRKNGLFTNLYDAAARFGETEVFKAWQI